MTELSDERFKGEVACQVLEGERAERLRVTREITEMQVSTFSHILVIIQTKLYLLYCMITKF